MQLYNNMIPTNKYHTNHSKQHRKKKNYKIKKINVKLINPHMKYKDKIFKKCFQHHGKYNDKHSLSWNDRIKKARQNIKNARIIRNLKLNPENIIIK